MGQDKLNIKYGTQDTVPDQRDDINGCRNAKYPTKNSFTSMNERIRNQQSEVGLSSRAMAKGFYPTKDDLPFYPQGF